MKDILFVLGMHRSGTSAVTRVCALLGAQLPETLMGATESNPRGHWESDSIVNFNNQILEGGGGELVCFTLMEFTSVDMAEL